MNKFINILHKNGFEGYVVGGYVRNMVMNMPPSDIDICTNALPDEICKVFSNYSVYKTGIKHGTVTVMIDNTPAEITTYRIDGEYKNHRQPDKVLFTSSLSEDLSRRDFTINAMAYNETEGIIDLFGGKSDIEKKIIRCVGNAEKRFEEDALRILRALRFSSVLNFDIEEETKKAIFLKYKLLQFVSKERITEEFLKLLSGKNAKKILSEFKEVFTFLSGDNNFLQNIYPEDNDPYILLSFFNNVDFLRLSSKDEKAIKFIKRHKDKTIISDYDILSLLNSGGKFATEKVLSLSKNRHLFNNFNAILAKDISFSTKNLKISGEEIISLGYSGKMVGKILSTVLGYVMEGKIDNESAIIKNFIKKNNFFA